MKVARTSCGLPCPARILTGLKALFRPMTVMVPDLVLICENMLMAEGFIEAKVYTHSS